LCGGECYLGGGGRPGDLDRFLSHVEENCLTICGLPFKKLDKKTKKQWMHSRKQELTRLIEEETSGRAILELSVMYLFQLIKNHIVFGGHLADIVLELLFREKKLSEEVAKELKGLAERLRQDEVVDPEQVERVRAVVLGREQR
jgi:hypothetical protein